jgi:DNA-binding NarL/FixJ family response regulator
MYSLNGCLLKPSIKNWFSHVKNDLSNYCSIKIHLDYNSLINSNELHYSNNVQSILLIDIENDHYIELLSQVRVLHPASKFIGLGILIDLEKIKSLLQQGFHGILEIGDTTGDLYNAIRTVSANKIYLSVDKVHQLLNDMIVKDSQLIPKKNQNQFTLPDHLENDFSKLTEKQKEIIQYLIKGYTYKEIASFLGVTSFTINQRAKSVYKKFNVNSRNELAYLFLKV